MFKIDKRKFIIVGSVLRLKTTNILYNVIKINKNVAIVIDDNGRTMNVDFNTKYFNDFEVVINEVLLNSLITIITDRLNIIDNKLNEMEKLNTIVLSRIGSQSSDLIKMCEENIPYEEKLYKVSSFLKKINQFSINDTIKVVSNNKKHNLALGGEYLVIKTGNPITVLLPNDVTEKVFKSDVEVVEYRKDSLLIDKEILLEDLKINNTILEYIKTEGIDEFDGNNYLSLFFMELLESKDNKSKKIKEIVKVLNSTINKINIDELNIR